MAIHSKTIQRLASCSRSACPDPQNPARQTNGIGVPGNTLNLWAHEERCTRAEMGTGLSNAAQLLGDAGLSRHRPEGRRDPRLRLAPGGIAGGGYAADPGDLLLERANAIGIRAMKHVGSENESAG